MQQQHVAGREPARQAREHAPWIAARGIEAAPAPGHVAQAAARQHEIQQRAAEACRRAEEPGRPAAQAREQLLRELDLATRAPDAEAGKGMRMPVAVVLHAVPALRYI